MDILKCFLKMAGSSRIFSKFYTVILLVILSNQLLSSQIINEQEGAGSGKEIREKLYITVDRDIYFTGEHVWFKIYSLNNLNNAPWDLSKVVYVELLDKNNFPLKQLKVTIDKGSGSSVLVLPDNISSGNYILRAYTSWMKNWIADQYFYSTISVINPFEKIDKLNISLLNQPGDTLKSNINIDGPSPAEQSPIKFNIALQKSSYPLREGVKVLVTATDNDGNPVEADLSVSVTKSVLLNRTGQAFNSQNPDSSARSENIENPSFIPELEGHIISGYMRSKSTGEPLKLTDISLSFVGKTARCKFSKTDENGEFNFVLKEPGLSEIVIQPLVPDNNGYFVDLNQPFSSKFTQNKIAPLYIDSSKIDGINNAIVSMQINNIYAGFRQPAREDPKQVIPDFFGKPENTIKMSDYIELTSLREVVKEIIPYVYALKQDGEYDFKLINKYKSQPFENKPLVLVDGVPIYNVEKVLNIASKDIEKTDVTNTKYFFSEYIFDGILSFVTKKGNLSAMEFDNSIFRQVFEGCQEKVPFYSPDYSTDLLKESKIPDFRNTLCWMPDLHTGKDGNAEIDFYTSDESSEYMIVVEGIAPDGRYGFSTTSLIVK